jgi:preprotein translocase subunit YajC
MNLLLILLQQQASQGQGGFKSWGPSVIMIVLLIVIFYFFMIRPQKKQREKLQAARDALTKGDKVVTAGGIHGKIVEIRDQTFVIAVEDNTHIEVEKSAITFNEAALK